MSNSTNMINLQMRDMSLEEEIINNISLMKHLKEQIKDTQDKYDFLKEKTINQYFIDHPEFHTREGILVATYKPQIRIFLNQAKLKKDKPDLYETYSDVKEVYTFLIK